MLSDSSRVILPEPPDELKLLSERLQKRIATVIRKQESISFSRFMEMALYEPGLGYYSAGLRKFGEGGDFVTAPELGNVFARCLARQVEQVGNSLGDYAILEIGAGTGRLASDLLGALQGASAPSRYLILERSADLRRQQYETIKSAHPGLLERVFWLDEPPTEPWQGVLVANEVIDALAVEQFCISNGAVQQLRVSIDDDGFKWSNADAPDTLDEAVRHVMGQRFDEITGPYQSEICTMMHAWLAGLCTNLQRGCALVIDYGYPRREYYSVQRSMGTLICNYQHRAHDDVFWYPGLQDISAFVDFTALAEAADRCGLECSGYTSQAMFLLSCGLEHVLAELEQLPDRERMILAGEVRELTMPGAMGEKFQVMALSRSLDFELMGFDHLDLRYRL
jgi:SAM-dependent MidA family methyltransferase